MIARLAAVAAVLFAPAAWAQEGPPTPEQVAAARAHADAVIERAEAGAFFVNVTTTEMPAVRHVRSGMTCEFVGNDPRDVIRIYDQKPDGPVRGDDVSCGTWIGRTYISMFATRYPQAYSREDLMQSAVAALRQSWPQARPYEGPLKSYLLDGQTEPLAAAFDVELEGRASRSIILIQNIDGWTFKTRATGPAGDDSVNALSGMAFSIALPGAYDAVEAMNARR